MDDFSVRQSFAARRSSVADDGACFQNIVLPHLDDAYGLARWLTGNHADAEEVMMYICLCFICFEFCTTTSRRWTVTLKAAPQWRPCR